MTAAPDQVGRWRGVDVARWSLCAFLILAVHAGAAAYVILRGPSDPSAGPQPGIAIDILPEPSPPPSEAAERPAGPLMERTEDQPEKVVEKPDDEEVTTEVMKPAEPEPEAPPAPLAPQPDVAVAPPRAPEPPAEAKPIEKKPELPKRPVAKKKPVPKPSPATTAPLPAPQTERTRTSQGETNAQSASRARADWSATVAGMLRRNTRYPASAERRGIQGVATVSLTVSRSGSVVSARLTGSAGDSELDQEAASLVRRVAPYPPLPEEIRGASYTVSVPIRFYKK